MYQLMYHLFWENWVFVSLFQFYSYCIYLLLILIILEKQAALSVEAEKVLEEAMHDSAKGDVIYFWGRVDLDGSLIGSNNALTFWSMCDILNGGNCRYIIWKITVYSPFVHGQISVV